MKDYESLNKEESKPEENETEDDLSFECEVCGDTGCTECGFGRKKDKENSS